MKKLILAAMTGMVLFGIGCSTAPSAPSAEVRGKPFVYGRQPDWVNRGGTAFPDSGGKFVYGVGMSDLSSRRSLRRETAEHRARAAIARALRTYVASLTRDHLSSSVDTADIGSDEYVSRISREVSEATLYDCQVLDNWVDAEGAMYILARVSSDSIDENFRQVVRSQKQLLREQEREKALKALDTELEKADLRDSAQLRKYGMGAPLPADRR